MLKKKKKWKRKRFCIRNNDASTLLSHPEWTSVNSFLRRTESYDIPFETLFSIINKQPIDLSQKYYCTIIFYPKDIRVKFGFCRTLRDWCVCEISFGPRLVCSYFFPFRNSFGHLIYWPPELCLHYQRRFRLAPHLLRVIEP